MFLTLFQFLTILLTSKHLKLFSMYLVVRNGMTWKTCFSAPKNAKKISCNIKTKCVTDFLMTVRSSNMKDYTCHYVVSTQNTNVYINFNKNIVNFKHKVVVSNLHVCSNGLGKMWLSYIFHFSIRILTTTHTKVFNFFSKKYVAISNTHYSAHDNVETTWPTHYY